MSSVKLSVDQAVQNHLNNLKMEEAKQVIMKLIVSNMDKFIGKKPSKRIVTHLHSILDSKFPNQNYTICLQCDHLKVWGGIIKYDNMLYLYFTKDGVVSSEKMADWIDNQSTYVKDMGAISHFDLQKLIQRLKQLEQEIDEIEEQLSNIHYYERN
jgi:hypothetical protein